MGALSRRSRRETNTWPGFVDALATLLMVIIFLLMIFIIAQFFLSQVLSGRENDLSRMNSRVAELSELLSLEQKSNRELRANVATIAEELSTAVSARDSLTAQINDLTALNAAKQKEIEEAYEAINADKERTETNLATIAKLKNDIVALKALRDDLETKVRSMASQLDETEGRLIEERKVADSSKAQLALMNQQLSEIRRQMKALNDALEASENLNEQQKAEIRALGSRLNSALATKVQELSRYRSEFFGELRKVLSKEAGVRIVGDRFVFQSEVLFSSGSAEIGPGGEIELDKLANSLKAISEKIPEQLDWILRVDGHTDAVPIATSRFPSNWELSSARAISVVRYLINHGIPANRLVAAGFGEYQPIDTRKDEIANRRNRRIELKLTQR